jgi:hypothetical protein
MALSPTGSISVSQINSELGRSATAQFSFSDATYQKLVMESSSIDLANARGAAYIGSAANLNLYAAIGSPSSTATYRILFDSGVTIGGTYGNNALNVGQFPSGSTVYINNYGNILGYGGPGGGWYSAGQQGGTAINAYYGGQAVVINNYGLIYGGGGGGGSGGGGGTGGQGGGGYYGYQANETYWRDGGYYVVQTLNKNGSQASYNAYWAGSDVTGDGNYYQGAYQGSDTTSSKYVGGYTSANYWAIGQNLIAYTSGGAGGGGGAGGAGGRGYGYDGANSGGAGGSPGGGGAGGGINAGAGGSGGYGGTGGTGGGWGAYGNTGDSGAYGNSGGNGNNGYGAGGSPGGGGAGGGAPGYYLYKAGQNVTLNNYGGLAGAIA